MRNFFKKYLAVLFLFSIFIVIITFLNQIPNSDIKSQTATIFDPSSLPIDAKPASGFAWNDTIGWINFGDENSNPNGRVYISNNKLYGYAWGENIGWISMTCENDDDCTEEYGVTQNNSDGILTGYAWGENIGWIAFAPTGGGVTIDPLTGEFSGYAWGENIGWISMADESIPYGVISEWINYNFEYLAGENGTITGETTQLVLIGTSGTEVIAIPNTDYNFDNWSDGLTTANRTDINASSSLSLTANFKKKSSGGGSVCNTCIYSEWSPCIANERTRTVDQSNCCNVEALTEICSEIIIATTTPINITISPITSTILVGDQIQFTTEITGTTSTGVNWIVFPIEENNYYGSINNNGLYTAPDNIRELTYLNIKIIATAQADNTKTATADIRVERKPTCVAYTYSPWSICINASQTRNTLSSIPADCVGGVVASTTQACIMPIATSTEPCLNYTYSEWGACLNNKQTRNILASNPENCLGGIQMVTEQNCVMKDNSITEDQIKIEKQKDKTDSEKEKTENKVIALLDISSIVTDNVAIFGTTTEKIFLGAKKALETPTGDIVTKTITTVGVIGGGVAVSSAVALNGAMVADLFFMPLKLWGLFLSILGLKKRNRPWGTVYDSVTKQPIDPAYIVLKNLKTGKEEISITDLDGRYGFLVSKGIYILNANKTNYLFPSKKLAGQTADVLYNNLYFGEELNIEDPSILLSKNIPLDPLKFDWNEFTKGQKKLMKFYSEKEKLIRIITDWLFRIGFLISLLSLFLVSAPYNLIIFGLYLVIYSLRKIGLRQKALGSLIEKNGNPLSFAIIRIFDAELKVEITHKVANKIGRYYCLVNKGKYYIKIEKKNDDENYTEIFTSPVFEANEGIINKSFII